MRPGQSNKRSRGRGGRKGPSPLSRSYESNGPDVKIRGTAQHIADKYVNLARDAQSSGDTVLSEAYWQHAEHYYRIVATAQQQMNQPVNVKRADDPIETDDSETQEEKEGFDPSDPDSPQPSFQGQNGAHNRGNGRDDDEGDGERRPRRNRGRQRRGRGDDVRAEERSGDDETRARRDTPAPATDPAAEQPAEPASLDSTDAPSTAVENGHADTSADAAAGDDSKADEAKPTRARRAPRARKPKIDVSDRHDSEDPQASGHVDGAEMTPPAPADEAPKAVAFGDELPPVQATADDS